jgi:Protein of unknown function (DUF3828)
MKVSNVAFGILWLWVSVVAVQGQARPADRQQSCSAFVQGFYEWYLKKDAESFKKHLRTSDVALKERPEVFDAELSRRLKEDSTAQDKVKDEIVGLDFDPVLGAQDTCSPYTFRKVTIEGDSCRVEVVDTCGASRDKPDVVPELVHRSGQWVFVNFRYPQVDATDDLLTILRKLREERKGQSATAPR